MIAMLKLIEDKLTNILADATINNVATYVVQGIDKWVNDFNEVTDYPRIVIFCTGASLHEVEIGARLKEYTVEIYLLCYAETQDEVANQLNIILERVENALISNQKLDNLSDNNKETVYSSDVLNLRVSKFGHQGFYAAVARIDFSVYTERYV